jgi:hypothetical protein
MTNTTEQAVMRRNWDASPLDLYDLPHPTAPRWLQVRYAIDEYRDGRRPPVML